MIGEFKAFLLKHGVIALAVAVVIGGAVQKLVAAIVGDLIMPIIGAMTPSGNWRAATVSIGAVKLGVGDFLGAMLDFLIIALVVFLIVKALVREPPPAPAPPAKS
jgi:large conductance mechanosensitive channel